MEHTGTGATNTAITAADGRYTLRSLRPGGPYTLTVTRIGFGEQTREGLELLLGRFMNLDVTILPEAVAIEGIEVEVPGDVEFDPGRIGISTLVTADIITELPALTRDFVDFAALSPLVRASEEGVSVAGANYRFNTLNVDGALNQDVFGLSTGNVAGGRAGGRVIPLEAVEQFQVLVTPFDMRQSGFTGGALSAVTKSGTNDFETTAFGFYRGDDLVGELVVDDVTARPGLSTSHAGFTIGGPIRRVAAASHGRARVSNRGRRRVAMPLPRAAPSGRPGPAPVPSARPPPSAARRSRSVCARPAAARSNRFRGARRPGAPRPRRPCPSSS